MVNNDSGTCDLCRRGQVQRRSREIAFHQWTDKGYVFCRATIPVGVCDRCGAESWDQTAEEIIDAAVRRAYDALP